MLRDAALTGVRRDMGGYRGNNQSRPPLSLPVSDVCSHDVHRAVSMAVIDTNNGCLSPLIADCDIKDAATAAPICVLCNQRRTCLTYFTASPVIAAFHVRPAVNGRAELYWTPGHGNTWTERNASTTVNFAVTGTS